MEQFRQLGEILGSMRALMVLHNDIQINRSQCRLLLDVSTSAFETIADEIRQNLRLGEKAGPKWKALEQPLRELQRVFREGETYIRQCTDPKDWWTRAVRSHRSRDCVEFHLHNLFTHFPAAIEAVEIAGEIAGLDQDEMKKKRVILTRKYDKVWDDSKLFQWRFGKQYLVDREVLERLESAWKEDQWRLIEALRDEKRKKKKKKSNSSASVKLKLVESMLEKLTHDDDDDDDNDGGGGGDGDDGIGKGLFPSSILLSSKGYQVRRRLGDQLKEIQWLGESFAMRHFFGEIRPSSTEISSLLSLSHPNVVRYLAGFHDEEKKEVFLIMELMSRDLSTQVKENFGPRRRALSFSLPVIVDLMLQIARGMEYLHSRKIYHGDLNPSNVLVKPRNGSEGYLMAKISGFGLASIGKKKKKPNESQSEPFIWHAPEVLAEQEKEEEEQHLENNNNDNDHNNNKNNYGLKYSEKADVYSFGMICFELLTGKVPFEDSHLQGDKMSRNIRAGERPLFPHPSPKYLVTLTKKCWQTDPSHRPSFSSICRILRYIKKFLSMNGTDQSLLPALQSPVVDYYELEAAFLKKALSGSGSTVAQIPFQMFSYRVTEKEKTCVASKDNSQELISDAGSIFRESASVCNDEVVSVMEDHHLVPAMDTRSVFSEAPAKRTPKKSLEFKGRKGSATPRAQRPRQLPMNPLTPWGRSLKLNRDNSQLKPIGIPVKHGREKST